MAASAVRPNYFLAIRLTAADVLAHAEAVQHAIIEQYPSLAKQAIPPKKMHFTLGDVMNLPDDDAVDRVRRVLADEQAGCAALLAAAGSPAELAIGGLGDFGGRVLWAGARDGPALQALHAIAARMRTALVGAGVAVKIERDEWNPHCTLFKSRAQRRGAADGPQLAPSLYEPWCAVELGVQPLTSIALCAMAATGDDGFYRVDAAMPLS